MSACISGQVPPQPTPCSHRQIRPLAARELKSRKGHLRVPLHELPKEINNATMRIRTAHERWVGQQVFWDETASSSSSSSSSSSVVSETITLRCQNVGQLVYLICPWHPSKGRNLPMHMPCREDHFNTGLGLKPPTYAIVSSDHTYLKYSYELSWKAKKMTRKKKQRKKKQAGDLPATSLSLA